MSKKRRLKLAAFIIAAQFFAVVSAGAQTKLKLIYPPAFNLVAAFIAQDQGYLAKHDLDVDLSLSTSPGAVITAALMSDTAQIGATAVTTLLQANEQGLDVVILAGTSAKEAGAPDVAGILVRQDSPIHTAADLAGKKFAVVGFGGTADLETRTWVRQHAADPRRVNWVEMPFPQMSDSVGAGIIDAASVVDPFYSRAVATKSFRSLGDFTSVMPGGTVSIVFAATRGWAAKNAPAVANFRAALDDAVAYISDPAHQAAVLGSLARWTKLPPQAVTASALPALYANRVTPDSLSFWAGVVRDNDLIKTAPDLSSMILP